MKQIFTMQKNGGAGGSRLTFCTGATRNKKSLGFALLKPKLLIFF